MAKKKKSKGVFTDKEKVFSSLVLVSIVLWMLTYWFGYLKDYNEIQGVIILQNPISFICLLMIVMGIWYNFKIYLNGLFIYLGIFGLIGMEIWYFLTWHLSEFKYINIAESLKYAMPEFYIGFALTIFLLVITTIFIRNK